MIEPSLRRVLLLLAVAASALAAGAPALAAGIEVKDAWARPTPPGAPTGAAYFTLENGGENDRLVGVSTPVAKHAELHASRMEGGVMKMRHLDAVEVKKGSPVAFAPSGRHVMLMGLKKPLKAGERFPIVLRFARGGAIEVQVEVRDGGGTGGHPMGSSMGDATKGAH